MKVNGGVPPPAVDVQVKGLPEVAAAQLILLVSGWPTTLIVVLAVAVGLPVLESLAVLLTVPLFTLGEQVTEMVFVVDEPEQAVGKVQVKV